MEKASLTLICKNSPETILEVLKKFITDKLIIDKLCINNLGSNVNISANVKIIDNLVTNLLEITTGHQIIRESFERDTNYNKTKSINVSYPYDNSIFFLEKLLSNDILINKLEINNIDGICNFSIDFDHKNGSQLII